MPVSFPIFHAAGPPRELGWAHGAQAADRIRGFIEYQAHVLGMSRGELRERALMFVPLFEQQCPHLLEEIHGLAEGADLPFADALIPQLRGELAHVSTSDAACTSFVVGPNGTSSGEILIGQTSDMDPELIDFAYVLHVAPVDRPRALMWTFGGMIGYHGINEHSVGHFANALGGGPTWKRALSHYPLKRRILEQESLDGVLALMRRMPVCSNGNYVLCDGRGNFADVELTTQGPEILRAGDTGFLAHANHFLCDRYACAEARARSLPDSPQRQSRIEELIRSKFGSITVGEMQAFLSDHQGHPTSICRHSHDGTASVAVAAHPMLGPRGCTVAALVAEPARGTLWISRGNPCCNAFVEYRLQAEASSE